jgi:hypothetical protein
MVGDCPTIMDLKAELLEVWQEEVEQYFPHILV